MGDTSSGKSSLLSAISGVSFPSADQLTTRCPTQLILTSADKFRGNVRLVRFRGDDESRNGEKSSDTGEDKEDLTCLDDVPKAITKLTQKLVDEGQYISDDQIVIEMSGPDLPNLTLTDLPGLVRTVGDHENEDIIPRVRNMVNRYMSQERTVIIAVVPANVDMHNTEILQAAQEADPKGTRTIAVVTKVDLVDAGAEQAVHDLLLNKKKKMRLGYHAVKCRSQRELSKGVTIDEGVLNETAFFTEHEYWRKLPTDLWGVPNLSDRLVTILQDNIRRSLPNVISEINARMEVTEMELLNMGMPLDSLGAQRQQFGKWVNQYLRQIEAAINGQYELLSFSARPHVPVNGGGKKSSQSNLNVRLRAVLRVKEAIFQDAIKEVKDRVYHTEAVKPQEEVEVGDAVLINVDGQWHSGHVTEVCGLDIREEHDGPWRSRDSWRVDEFAKMKKFIRENRGDELAIFPSYQVFCNLFRRCVDEWERPTQQLLNDYRIQTKLVSDYVTNELQASSRVAQFIRSTVSDVLDSAVKTANHEMQILLRAECRPYTQDQRLFKELDERRMQGFRDKLQSALITDDYGKVLLADVMKAVTSVAIGTDDREAREMQMALETYLDVAVPRFADEIPMRLDDLVLRRFVAGMADEFNNVTDEKLVRLMQDSEQKVAMRKRLKNTLACLEGAKKEIEMVC
ncbi:hypothetical protein PHYBOEH_011338 [Phytophthora boehmeriae]|uniref:Interferon-induced GTP-binding protein Mx n=1 Tax=Phytophthora boehmeriae TaxID=109152 RepID=A0A8T1VHD6_9STRA|nr:hypothetical protein PHYBOEH_011338 [Phytophthora boehmeriae]